MKDVPSFIPERPRKKISAIEVRSHDVGAKRDHCLCKGGHGLLSVLASIDPSQRKAGSRQLTASELKIVMNCISERRVEVLGVSLKSTHLGPVIIPCIQLLPNRQLDDSTIFPACIICGMNSQNLDLPAWQHPLL